MVLDKEAGDGRTSQTRPNVQIGKEPADLGFVGRIVDNALTCVMASKILRYRLAENRLRQEEPNLNAFAERFVRSIKEECLTKMIFVGQGALRRALTEYMTHFHEERNHQGLENRLIR